jgi:hypothetical protein
LSKQEGRDCARNSREKQIGTHSKTFIVWGYRID